MKGAFAVDGHANVAAGVGHEPSQGIGACAVGPQVLGRVEPFLDAAVQGGAGAHLLHRFGNGLIATADEADGNHSHVDHEGHPEPPRHNRHHHHDAHDEQQGADHLDHHEGEEVRHGGHIAVYPFDQLAGRAGAVEFVIEAQHVGSQSHPEVIGGVPGHAGGHPRHHDRGDQIGQRDHQVGSPEPGQGGRRRPFEYPIDDLGQQDRPGQSQG